MPEENILWKPHGKKSMRLSMAKMLFFPCFTSGLGALWKGTFKASSDFHKIFLLKQIRKSPPDPPAGGRDSAAKLFFLHREGKGCKKNIFAAACFNQLRAYFKLAKPAQTRILPLGCASRSGTFGVSDVDGFVRRILLAPGRDAPPALAKLNGCRREGRGYFSPFVV